MLMRYTQWANQRLHHSLAGLADDLLYAARPGRSKGMMGTLGHLYVVDLIWKGHLLGEEHGFTSRTLEREIRLPELVSSQAAIDAWYVEYADALSEEELTQTVDFRFVDGGEGHLSRGDILLHIANHKTYHRGYVADMLYESGAKPPTIDLPVFLRDEYQPR
jgi:uncharacterized damage-inducible protein DinB